MNNQLTIKWASRVDVLLRLQLMNGEHCDLLKAPDVKLSPRAASRSADGFLLVWRDFKALLLVHEGLCGLFPLLLSRDHPDLGGGLRRVRLRPPES